MSVAKSVKYLRRWLKFQFGHDGAEKFVKTLFYFTSKNSGKPNSIWLFGPPNSGEFNIIILIHVNMTKNTSKIQFDLIIKNFYR